MMIQRELAVVVLVLCVAGGAGAAPTASFIATPIQGTPCVAPCAVHFDAIGNGTSQTTDPVYDREFHSLSFEWSFGDPSSGQWSTDSMSRDHAFGAIAGHLYASPGSYVVSLTVANPAGETSSTTRTVIVTDPNAHFSASNTYCFANSGTPGGSGFAACPVSLASQHVVTSSFDDALRTHCDATASKLRCLFRRGDTFQNPSVIYLSLGPDPGLIASFGSGSRPIVTGGGGLLGLGDSWTVAHLDVRPTSPANENLFSLPDQVSGVTLYDIEATGVAGGCVASAASNTPAHSDRVAIVDLDCLAIPSASITGLFLKTERTLVLGSTLDNQYSGEFNLRTVHFPRSLIQHCVLKRPQEDAGNQRNSIQIRAWGGEIGPPVTATEYVIISDNLVSQDNATMFLRTCQDESCTPDSANPELRHLIIERNFFSFSTGGSGPRGELARGLWLQGGDITVRNNIVDAQGLATTLGGNMDTFVQHAPEASGTLSNDRIHVFDNTVYYDDVTARDFRFCAGGVTGSGHQCRNNLAYLPNQTGTRAADDGGGWVSSNNAFPTSNPFVAPVPQQGQTDASDFRLASGNSSLADGGFDFLGLTGSYVHLDHFGVCRRTALPPGIGAHEPGALSCSVPLPPILLPD